jgi:16S rRNA (cytosine1402-N4)-methyltransferase
MIAFSHQTILRDEVLDFLEPISGRVFVDCTLGGGGHTEGLLNRGAALVFGIDRDMAALAASRERLASFGDRVEFVHANFDDVQTEVTPRQTARNVPAIAGLIADLGVSSYQLDEPSRGMSFRQDNSDAPLDMRMDLAAPTTAMALLEQSSEQQIATILWRFGEERASRKIARSIRSLVDEGALHTVGDLRHAVWRVVGGKGRHDRIDPATRTFQAIRIAVNCELEQLETLLTILPTWLSAGAVACLISFHSLEDRLVKRAFADKSAWQPLHKKVIVATDAEVAQNPRARSAKLRAARRISPVGGADERS